MLTEDDRHYAKKRKRLWDNFGWVYKSVNYLSKNHSLNCGCSMCRMRTYYNRFENKQERLKSRMELRRDIDDLQ